jgi:hypothetical protein
MIQVVESIKKAIVHTDCILPADALAEIARNVREFLRNDECVVLVPSYIDLILIKDVSTEEEQDD